MSNYWRYRIYNDGFNRGCNCGETLLAEYVAETSPEAVRKDLATKNGVLQSYLKNHCGVDDPSKYPSGDRLEALLGGLMATTYCSVHLRIAFSTVHPRTAVQLPGAPSNLGELILADKGVRLWLCQRGDSKADA